MKVLRPKRNLTVNIDGVDTNLKSKFRYIVPHHIVDTMTQNGYIQLFDHENFVNEKNPPKSDNGDDVHKTYEGKSILVSRTDGIGDFFMIARSIKEIRSNCKPSEVVFSASPRHRSTIELFKNDVDRFLPMPILWQEYERCDYCITFENIMESNERALTVNAYDLMAEKFGVSIGEDHGVSIRVNSWALAIAEKISLAWGRPVIGIQVAATAVLRSWPFPYINHVVEYLDKMGIGVLLLDTKETIESLFTQIDLTKVHLPYSSTYPGSLELSVALASKCKMIIAPDSAFVYIADALGMPVIGIYGPVSSSLRARGLNVYALECGCVCHNCQKHTELPCVKSKDSLSPCMKAITPELVIGAIHKIMAEAME